MFSMKSLLAVVMVSSVVLSACNTNRSALTPEEKARIEEQKVLPNIISIAEGTYTVKTECVDAAKTEKLKDLHWTVKIKKQSSYLESQQNFDTRCEDACSSAEAGQFRINELQAIFTATKKLNIETNEFADIETPVSKVYFVSSYDASAGMLVLLDNTNLNVCQGKMILTLRK